MPVQPDELGVSNFKLGDLVYNIPTETYGRIIRIDAEHVHVGWAVSEPQGAWASMFTQKEMPRLFRRLCRNCDMRMEDHADGGKCLYSPTTWS